MAATPQAGKMFWDDAKAPKQALPEIQPRSETTRTCCGRTIEPQLAEIRDKSGENRYYTTVWLCPVCRKVRR